MKASRVSVAAVAITIAAAMVLLIVLRGSRSQPGTPVVTLLSDGATGVTLAAGTPVFFEVFLSGLRNTSGPSVGSWMKPWHELLEVRASRDGHDVPLPVVSTARPHVRELSIGSGGQPLVRNRLTNTAALDGTKRVFRMEVAASPETTSRLSRGRYSVVAVLHSPWWHFWGWRGRAQSSSLVVVVETAATTAQNERKLAGLARFFLKTGQHANALQAAQTWTAQAPASAAAQMMLGDVFEAMGQTEPARVAYERAMVHSNTGESEEPPTAILTRLDRLSRAAAR